MGHMKWLALGLLSAGLVTSAGCKSSLQYYKQGQDELRNGSYDQAIDSFSSAIDKDKFSDISWLCRGDAHMAKKEYEEAIKDYGQAIAVSTEKSGPNPWFFNRRGLAQYNLKAYDKALADWTQAKSLEDRRAAKGLKIRKSDEYVKMQETREELLPETERLAKLMPATPGIGTPGTEVAPPTASTLTPAQQAAIDAASQEESLAQMDAEEQRKKQEALDKAMAEEERRKQEALAQQQRDEEIRKQKQLADEQKSQADAEAQKQREMEALAVKQREADAAAQLAQQQEEEDAILEATKVNNVALGHPELNDALVAPAAVMVHVPRAPHVTNLSGTWVRRVAGADDITLSLQDDGFRVIGQVKDGTDYVYYELSLSWQGDHSLSGLATFKENFDECKFETAVNWTFEVTDATHAKALIQDVEWNDQCQETNRTWNEYTLDKR